MHSKKNTYTRWREKNWCDLGGGEVVFVVEAAGGSHHSSAGGLPTTVHGTI